MKPARAPRERTRSVVSAASALRLIPHLHRATHRVGLGLLARSRWKVTQAEGHILAVLAEAEPRTVNELHRALAHRRSTLSSVLDRLEARALVHREPSDRDRRSVVVRLTARGRKAAGDTHRVLERWERTALRGLSANQQKELVRALDRIGQAG